MMEYEGSIKAPSLENPAVRYWQASEHLRLLLLHPEWECFALQTLLGQTQAQLWRLRMRQQLRFDDEQSPQMQSLQEKVASLQQQLQAAQTAPSLMLTQKQAARERKYRKKVVYDPSLTSVQQVWDQFWRTEKQLAKGWSYQNNKSMEQQSKLRRGLVGWVLLKVGIELPASHCNTPGPFSPLWQMWAEDAVHTQLSCLERRLQAVTITNRRTGRLGALKGALMQEVNMMQSHAAKQATRKAARRAARRNAGLQVVFVGV